MAWFGICSARGRCWGGYRRMSDVWLCCCSAGAIRLLARLGGCMGGIRPGFGGGRAWRGVRRRRLWACLRRGCFMGGRCRGLGMMRILCLEGRWACRMWLSDRWGWGRGRGLWGGGLRWGWWVCGVGLSLVRVRLWMFLGGMIMLRFLFLAGWGFGGSSRSFSDLTTYSMKQTRLMIVASSQLSSRGSHYCRSFKPTSQASTHPSPPSSPSANSSASPH